MVKQSTGTGAAATDFARSARAAFRQAEANMIRRRAHPADMRGAVAEALAEALGEEPPPPCAEAAGQAIADAVTAHAASFAPAHEPAYHDQRHQAEATVAMGWLCGTARRLGLLDAAAAATGVLAMAGHDLLHDGSVPAPGVLEARSAILTVALAAHAGLDAATQATIRRVILATDPHRSAAERMRDDLLCELAQEADLFGSLAPELGLRLSQNLAAEDLAARRQQIPSPESFAGRLRLLRSRPMPSQAARRLGLADVVTDQTAALATFGDGDAAKGAAILDARPPSQARTDYLTALAAVAAQ
jgi:hypothetical protein